MTAAHTYTQAGTLPASPSCQIAVCQHCRQTEVCRPVSGRFGARAYWYCVEHCYPLAQRARERTAKVGAAAQALCDCCGNMDELRAVKLRSGWTSLKYCQHCYSDRLADYDDVPECKTCGLRLRPAEYAVGRCRSCA